MLLFFYIFLFFLYLFIDLFWGGFVYTWAKFLAPFHSRKNVLNWNTVQKSPKMQRECPLDWSTSCYTWNKLCFGVALLHPAHGLVKPWRAQWNLKTVRALWSWKVNNSRITQIGEGCDGGPERTTTIFGFAPEILFLFVSFIVCDLFDR